MNQDQITGQIRAVVPILTMVLSHYVLDNETWTVILTSVSTAGVAIWSYFNNQSGKVIP